MHRESSLSWSKFKAEQQIFPVLVLVLLLFLICHTAFRIVFSGILIVKFGHSFSDFHQLTCLDFFPVLQFSCRSSSVQMFRPSTEPKPGIHAICQGIM